jgi:hypothetical protein
MILTAAQMVAAEEAAFAAGEFPARLMEAAGRAMADLGLVAGAGVMVMMALSLLVLPGLWRRVTGR